MLRYSIFTLYFILLHFIHWIYSRQSTTRSLPSKSQFTTNTYCQIIQTHNSMAVATKDMTNLQQQMILEYTLHRHSKKITQSEVGTTLTCPRLQFLQSISIISYQIKSNPSVRPPMRPTAGNKPRDG